MALCNLASRLLDPKDSLSLDKTFASLDKDGSGSLDGLELILALKAFEPNLTEDSLRVVLAYLHHFADTDNSGGVSVNELKQALLPFVGGPSHVDLKEVIQMYQKGEIDIFKLVVLVVELQPSSLHAAFAQVGLKVQEGGDKKGLDTSSGTDQVLLPATPSTLDSVLDILLPSNLVQIKQDEKDHFSSLVLLRSSSEDKKGSSPQRTLSASSFIASTLSCIDSAKRAQALVRMVKTSIEDGEPIVFDKEIGGTELILHDLAAIFSSQESGSADAAFRAADKDKSGSLDLGELAGVINGLHPEVDDDQMRLLLSFLFESETASDKKVGLQELKSILAPFFLNKI